MKFLNKLNNWGDDRLILYVVLLIVVGVILWAEYLPLVDLPQHAGQVTALDSLIKNQGASWAEDVVVNLDTPYLLGYSLILLLYQFVSINVAINIIVAFSLVLFIYAANQLRKSYSAPSIVNWIAIPSFLGFAYEWGFVTFILATPIGMLFYLLNKSWVDSKKAKYLLYIACVGILLYFSHILVFAFFCYFSYFYFLLSSIFQKNGDEYSLRFPNAKHFFIFTSLYLFFAGLLLRYVSKEDILIKSYGAIDGYPTDVITFSGFLQKTNELLTFPWISNIVNPVINSWYLLGIGVLLLILPAFMGYKPRKSFRYYFPVGAFLLMWFMLPDRAFNTSFIYQRYASLFLILYYLIWVKSEHAFVKQDEKRGWRVSKVFFVGLIILLVGKTVFNTISFNLDQDTKDYNAITTNVKSGSKIAYFPDIDQRTSRKTLSSLNYIYFPVWYQAKNNGWTDFNFAWFLPQIVRFKMDRVPEVTARVYPFAPENIINLKGCASYDYLLLKTTTPDYIINSAVTNSSCYGNKLILTRSGNWLLLGSN